jgi:phage regulator Rha-like protein
MTELSLLNGGSPLTMTSVEIAKFTGKEHFHVMRDIDAFVESFGHPNLDDLIKQGLTIEEREEFNSAANRNTRVFYLNKKAALLITSGYDVQLRLRIINRWEELELAAQKPLSPMEMVIWSAQRIMQIEAEQAEQAKQLEVLSSKVDDIAATNDAVLLQSDMFSVMGYCNLIGINITLSQASGYSRSLGSICKKIGLKRKEAVDPRFGRVFLYPRVVLHDFFVNKGLISL